jgi:hypothetical protein
MTQQKHTGGRKIVFKVEFNAKDNLFIEDGPMLIWAEGKIEATEKARETIRKWALAHFERELDDHLRVADIKVTVAEIVEP